MASIKIRFQAVPEKGLIVCHRIVDGVIQREYAKYTENGIRPSLDYLSPGMVRSWKTALKTMNWSK